MTATFASPLRWPAGWPRTKDYARKGGSSWRDLTLAKAADSLADELRLLGATNVVVTATLQASISGKFSHRQAQPDDPGAAVYFVLKGREMVMAQDGFDKVEKNIRSLAIAIEHLRGLERHGGAHMMERAFSGFTALPPPSGETGAEPEDRPVVWREELDLVAIPDGLPPKYLLTIAEQAFRDLAKKNHTDVGGDATRMIRLNKAIEMARQELKG